MTGDVRYAFIDALPDALLDPVVANPHGKLRPRVEAITVLRVALLDGRIPADGELVWPEPPMRAAIVDGLVRSGVAAHCAANPAITDEVLAGILGATHEAQSHCDELVAEWTIASRELDKGTRIVAVIPTGGPDDALLDKTTWQRIRADAAVIAGRIALEALMPLLDEWSLRASHRNQVKLLLDELAAECGAAPTRVAGVLRSIDWRASAELRRVMAGVPTLGQLIRLLGRNRAAQDPTNARALETAGERVAREVTVEQHAIHELHRVEIRGVERSDEIARMLASEAVLRRLPATRLLWHARRAERALLTYHADSVYTERVVLEQRFRDGVAVEHDRAERGPVIVVLDTSGSMRGAAETLAKAVVLQTLCVAELERRACYVYNFSGTGDLAEHQLELAGDGVAHALAFLSLSFSGGTDIAEALRRAVARVETEAWSAADILVVTDGQLGMIDGSLLRLVKRARERTPFHIHVALVRSGSSAEVEPFADTIHDVRSWLDGWLPDN